MPSRVCSTVHSSSIVLAILLLASTGAAQTKTWTTTPDFNLGTLNTASDTKFANEVVLGATPVSQTHIVWSDNFNYGLIVRLNSVTGKQTSRFDSVLNTINGVSTGVRPANEFCNWSNTGNCPGRVAVDTNGDVWIVNRAFGNQGSLSKFSGNVSHCIDRNNNGVIDTSNDKNGDGIIDMNPANGEYFGQNDECILATIPVGANNAWPRSVAVDKRGKIWVGTYNEGKIYRFNPHEPVGLELTVNVGGNPYSMASGSDYIFVSNGTGQTARVQIQTGAVDYAPCPGNYGIVADPGGQVAWLGSWMNQALGMYRADFSVTPHTCTLMSTGVGPTTAMTLDNEPAPGPYVWGANYTQEKVSKWTPAGVYIGSYAAGGTANAHGLSPDFQGNLWVVSDAANNQQQMSKLNTATGALIGSYSIGFLAADQAKFPTNCSTGYCDGATPYLYSDFTGVQIDRQAPYTYLGTWDAVYDGGAPNIPWSKVVWNTEPQGAVPAETSLALSVRAANTLAGLPLASFVVATSGAALANIVGEFVEISADLGGPGFVTPVLSDVTVNGPCPVVGNACCLQNSNCNDGNPCHVGTCPQPGGVCTFTPKADCCLVNGDCNDSNACTTDTCPNAGGPCLNAPIAGCCNSNADCSVNGTLCDVYLCSGPGGTCSQLPINGCCLTDVDCTKGSPCSNATCPTPGGFCVGGPIPGCCQQDSDCKTTNLCSPGTCTLATNTCATTPIAGCCNTDAQCDDLNPCTQDSCSGAGGMCVHSQIPGCCTPNDPMVGMACDVPQSPFDQPPCQAGKFVCTGGTLTCTGSVKPGFEICDGLDNNCDGLVDNPNPSNTPPLCTGTDVCIDGDCVAPCNGGEFPCPDGFVCLNGYCMPTDCSKIHCPAGQVCNQGACLPGDGGAATDGGSGSTSTSTGGFGGFGVGGTGGGSTSTAGAGGHGGAATSNSGGPFFGMPAGGACHCGVVGDTPEGPGGRLFLAALGVLVAVGRRRRDEAAR